MISPECNPRNELEQLLRMWGLVAERHIHTRYEEPGEQWFRATVTVEFPDGETVAARGERTIGKKATMKQACAAVLHKLRSTHPHLFVDWEEIRVDAQAGDALIKLAAYLSPSLESSSASSCWLQKLESNAHLARVFDQWKEDGHPELARWGSWLSDHRKGTLVEAALWREVGPLVVPAAGRHRLEGLIERLEAAGHEPGR